MQVNAFVVELGVRHWVENKGISIEEGTDMIKSVQVRNRNPIPVPLGFQHKTLELIAHQKERRPITLSEPTLLVVN